MDQLNRLLSNLPPEFEDLKTNLERVLGGESLDAAQTWGVALASALFIRHPDVSAAVRADAEAAGVDAAVLEDARAAAGIMGMNTVYYRFQHLMGNAEYKKMPVNLRMTRMKRVATSETQFELFSVGPAALAGCELCLKVHEAAVLKGGLSREQFHDAVRIAAVLNGLAVALDAA
jgi:alkyl hydroperoxide reductase subunit D